MSKIQWVCEIGSNHKGIPSLAFEMIRQASIANPGGIAKFQLRDKDDPVRGMPMICAHKLKEWCTHFGMEFLASIWSLEALEIAREVNMYRYKIAYQKQEDLELINEVLSDGQETFITTDTIWENPLVRNIFTVSAYPTYPSMLHMPKRFDEYYGYSSHVHGYADALVAIARGAKYIEKHVTLDKTENSIRDNSFSLSFEEFGQMVEIGREMARISNA